jgi:hypothetical protein
MVSLQDFMHHLESIGDYNVKCIFDNMMNFGSRVFHSIAENGGIKDHAK